MIRVFGVHRPKLTWNRKRNPSLEGGLLEVSCQFGGG